MQIIVAKILIDQGFVITSLNGFFAYELPWLVSQLITGIAFVIIVNANFIDGIDGFAISETIKNYAFIYLYIVIRFIS